MSDNNFQEPEEKISHTPSAAVIVDTDMLVDEPVIDRSHTGGQGTGETVPEWTPPEFSGTIEEDEQEEQKPTDHPFANDELMDLPEGEKAEAATYMADMALSVYGETKREIGNALIPIKKRRIIKLEEKGLIDTSIPIKSREGGYFPAQHYIDNYNEKATDVFGLRENFVKEVRPILIKEFAKKGIGLTPWQRIGVAVALDLKEDVKIAMGLRGTANEIIEAMKETTAAYNGYRPATAAPPPPPPPQQQQSAPVTEVHAEEIIETVIPPIVQQQPFETTNPVDSFEHIQNNRGGGAPMPASAVPDLSTHLNKSTQRVKPSSRKPSGKKRGPYKKKFKG